MPRRFIPTSLLLAALVLAPASAHAQGSTDDVLRRGFVFPGNDLTIDVISDAPGRLRVMRGEPGTVRVAARAAGGIAEAGLAGRERDRLALHATGAGPVTFIVVVPEEARVSVLLPDRHATETLGTLARTESYEWSTAAASQQPPGPSAPPGLRQRSHDRGDADRARRTGRAAEQRRSAGRIGDPGHIAYTADRAPASVVVHQLGGVRTLTVRWEDDRFQILTGRPARVDPGRTDTIELVPRGSPQDLVLVVPRDVERFSLVMDGSLALRLADGRATVLCSPVIDQHGDDGPRWITFTPDDGRLDCRAPSRDARIRRTRTGR